MLDVRFERISMGINEKKTLTPTLKMVEMALRNIGFSDGVWLLKSPHRTRKKGAERFRAIRFDGAGIRVRCKPGGNETCYEWTLFPPAGTDQDLLFSDLCGLHPKDLRVVRSATSVRSEAAVLGGFVRHLTEQPLPEASEEEGDRPEVLPSENEVLRQESHEEQTPVTSSQESPSDEDELEREFEETSLLQTPAEASEAFVRKMPTISSLDISGMESGRLRSDPVLDRALIALGIAMKGTDSIPRGVSSEVMVRKLNIGGLLERSRVYDSLKGAMKAIMMSLHRRGYIDRIMGKRNSEGGHWVKGYKMTGKGRKRLAMLVQMLDPSIAGELEEQVAEPVAPPEPAKEIRPPKAEGEDRIGTIKGMIDEHDSVKRQIADLKELLAESRRERDDDLVLVQGLRKAVDEKVGQIEALKAEMARIEGRALELESKVRMAESDAESLESEMRDLEVRKIELESGIFSGVRGGS